MGTLGSIGMAGAVDEGQVSLEAAVVWQLQANHFPPVSLDFLPVALRAIDLANDGLWASPIAMPNGLTRTVAQIVEGLHLEAFLDEEES